MKIFLGIAVLCLLLETLVTSPAEKERSNKYSRSPEVDDDFPEFDDHTTEKPKTEGVISRIGKILNSVLQIPISMFKAVNTLISNQSISKLREEVRNLNISYPKSG